MVANNRKRSQATANGQKQRKTVANSRKRSGGPRKTVRLRLRCTFEHMPILISMPQFGARVPDSGGSFLSVHLKVVQFLLVSKSVQLSNKLKLVWDRIVAGEFDLKGSFEPNTFRNQSKRSQTVVNSRKRSQTVANGRKQPQAVKNNDKRSQTTANGRKQSQTAANGRKRQQTVWGSSRDSTVTVTVRNV